MRPSIAPCDRSVNISTPGTGTGTAPVEGDKRNYPTALVVPNFEALESWGATQGLASGSREELCSRPEIVRHYLGLIAELLSDVAQYEKIKKVTVLPNEFTEESGELTPTLKVKRRVIARKYRDAIEKMYRG